MSLVERLEPARGAPAERDVQPVRQRHVELARPRHQLIATTRRASTDTSNGSSLDVAASGHASTLRIVCPHDDRPTTPAGSSRRVQRGHVLEPHRVQLHVLARGEVHPAARVRRVPRRRATSACVRSSTPPATRSRTMNRSSSPLRAHAVGLEPVVVVGREGRGTGRAHRRRGRGRGRRASPGGCWDVGRRIRPPPPCRPLGVGRRVAAAPGRQRASTATTDEHARSRWRTCRSPRPAHRSPTRGGSHRRHPPRRPGR